jgi:hypothetical protein
MAAGYWRCCRRTHVCVYVTVCVCVCVLFLAPVLLHNGVVGRLPACGLMTATSACCAIVHAPLHTACPLHSAFRVCFAAPSLTAAVTPLSTFPLVPRRSRCSASHACTRCLLLLARVCTQFAGLAACEVSSQTATGRCGTRLVLCHVACAPARTSLPLGVPLLGVCVCEEGCACEHGGRAQPCARVWACGCAVRRFLVQMLPCACFVTSVCVLRCASSLCLVASPGAPTHAPGRLLQHCRRGGALLRVRFFWAADAGSLPAR